MTDRNRPRQSLRLANKARVGWALQLVLMGILAWGCCFAAGLERPARAQQQSADEGLAGTPTPQRDAAEPQPTDGGPTMAATPGEPRWMGPLRQPWDVGEVWIDSDGSAADGPESARLRLRESSLGTATRQGVMDAASEQSWFGAAATPACAVELPPLRPPPRPTTLDILPPEPAPVLSASAALAIDPLTPPREAVPQLSPDLPVRDVSGERGPAAVQAPRRGVSPQVILRVMVAELDRAAAKTAGIDTDLTSSPATMLLRSLPGAASGSAAVLENRLTVCLGTRGLQERGALKIFSEPTLAVVSGRPAKVVVGGQPPGPATPGSGSSRPHPNDIPLQPTSVKILATLLTKDRIRLEVTPDPRPREPGDDLFHTGPSRRPAASAELGDGQTLAICGLIDAPAKPPPQSRNPFPLFGQWFSKPAPPPNPTEMLILVTAERLNPADSDGQAKQSDRSAPPATSPCP